MKPGALASRLWSLGMGDRAGGVLSAVGTGHLLRWAGAVPGRTEPGPARPRPGSPRAAVGGGRAEPGSRRGTSQHGSARLGSPLPPWHPSAPSATRPCTSVSASRPALPSRIPERSWSWRSSPPRPSLSPAVCPPALFPHRDEPASPRGARPGLTCSFSPRHPRSSALLCPASPGRAGGCWPWAGGTEGAGDPRQGGGSCPQVPAGQGSPAQPGTAAVGWGIPSFVGSLGVGKLAVAGANKTFSQPFFDSPQTWPQVCGHPSLSRLAVPSWAS